MSNLTTEKLTELYIAGEIVCHKTSNTSHLNLPNCISLKDFSQGIYYLLIQPPNGTLKEKFIKE